MLKDHDNVALFNRAKDLYHAGRHDDALRIYTELAEQGCLECQEFVGLMYLMGGGGIDQNHEEAEKWLVMAKQRGSIKAIYLLGILEYKKGDIEKALAYFQEAGEKGYSAAIYQMGKMYYFGSGVDQDLEKAFDLFDRAARMEHVFARRQKAILLMKGYKGILSVPKGIFLFITSVIHTLKVAINDPYDEKAFE